VVGIDSAAAIAAEINRGGIDRIPFWHLKKECGMQDAKTLVQIAMRHRLSCWIIQRGDDVSNALVQAR
jgi:hypothetical protein